MGHSKSTIVITDISLQNEQLIPSKLGYATDSNLGALHFDFALFTYFAEICKKNHQGTEITPGSKKGQRLLFACERARKLLSQLPEAKITVENLTDSGDVNFTIRRDDFAQINQLLIEKFKCLIIETLNKATLTPSDISAIEIVGGGIRMPILQNVISSLFTNDIPLGAKFDDASIALGAALHTLKVIAPSSAASSTKLSDTTPSTGANNDTKTSFVVFANQLTSNPEYMKNTIGLTTEEIDTAKSREQAMSLLDIELQHILTARNDMESFILEMRSTPKRKHGNKINSNQLESILTEYETWMWDNDSTDLLTLQTKASELKTKVNDICKEYFELTEIDRLAVEKALESEAIKAEAEKAANGMYFYISMSICVSMYVCIYLSVNIYMQVCIYMCNASTYLPTYILPKYNILLLLYTFAPLFKYISFWLI